MRLSPSAPHSGQVEMSFERVLVSASRGLTRDETHDLTRGYDLGTGEKEPRGGPANVVIEQFDVQRSMARGRVTRALEAVAADRVERQHVPGSRMRKLKVAALLNKLETFRFAFPAWVVAYRYKNTLYRVVVSGQDAHCISGNAPNSWLRILAVVLLSIVLVAAIALGVLLALGHL